MKQTAKLLAISLIASLLLLGGCAKKKQSDLVKIGISQLMEHESLDKTYQGFVDGLKEKGYEDGKNIELDFQNAQANQNNSQTIATQFSGGKKDLILAISTPSAQSIVNTIKDTPVLVTAVTNPENSKLVKSNENPDGNVTGTSDLGPLKQQIELIKELLPEIKTLGLLYTSSEDNSIYQIGIVKEICKEMGIETIEGTATSINDVQQVVTSLSSKVEAIYSPTDNGITSAMPTVIKICNQAKIPTFTGCTAEGDKSGMASIAIDYYDLGKLTALQAIEIIEGKKKPSEMPIEYLTECEVHINYENAKTLGIEIPEKYKK